MAKGGANAAKRRRSEKRARLTRPPRLPERVERILELPGGTLTKAAHIELTGNRRAVIDGGCGILEYDRDVIRINTGNGIVRFTGQNLMMSCLTDDNAIIEGCILSVEFM